MEFFFPELGLAIWILIIVLIILLPVLALIDVLRAEFNDRVTKLIWMLVIVFLPFLGSILYFVIGRSQRLT